MVIVNGDDDIAITLCKLVEGFLSVFRRLPLFLVDDVNHAQYNAAEENPGKIKELYIKKSQFLATTPHQIGPGHFNVLRLT